MWWMFLSVAFGSTELEAVSLPVDGARGLAVLGIEGAVEVVGADGSEVRVTGSVEGGSAVLSVRRVDGVLQVRVKGRDAEGLEVRVEVPRALAAVTVHDNAGPVAVQDLEGAVAVVGAAGGVAAQDVGSLRLQDIAGPVDANGVSGDLLADTVAGPVKARGVQGEVKTWDVAGPVDTERVAGETAPAGAASPAHTL